MHLSSPKSDLVIQQGAKILKLGGLVVFPTETVYGLGADATNEAAVKRLYKVKSRPKSHPVIVHISSLEGLFDWAINIPDYVLELCKQFWPGPLTVILNRSKLAADFITGGQDTVAIRVPRNESALKLLKQFENIGGNGVVAPSANLFGAVSPTSYAAAKQAIGQRLSRLDLILKGGSCEIGIESTILDCTGLSPSILRPGAITSTQLEISLGVSLKKYAGNIIRNNVRFSGQLPTHYSPKAKVFLSGKPCMGDGFIALNSIKTPEGAIRLISPKTHLDYARLLYFGLRKADKLKLNNIFAIPPEGDEIAIAITDRLTKASGNIKF